MVAILNTTGTAVVAYSYDAWGHPLSTTGSMADTLGSRNSLRYRGYVFDTETGLYYLQSRYYNSTIGRFISPDTTDVLTATPMALTDKNLYAYCDNNPVSREDGEGTCWLSALVGAAVNVATTFIAAKATGQEYTWLDAGVAALSGAANAIPVAGPWISGAITGTYTGIMAAKSGANLGEAFLCGSVAAVCTTASISNLANWNGATIDLATTAFTDVVFGTGYNGMAAATFKAVTTNAQARNNSISASKEPVPSIGGGYTMSRAPSARPTSILTRVFLW